MMLYDYKCGSCDVVVEALRDKTVKFIQCPACDGTSHRIISGTHAGTVWGYAASRGKSDEPPPGAMTTRELGEGMPLKEWKKKRKSYWRDETRKETGVYGQRKVFY